MTMQCCVQRENQLTSTGVVGLRFLRSRVAIEVCVCVRAFLSVRRSFENLRFSRFVVLAFVYR
jgi:hypothetical protein